MCRLPAQSVQVKVRQRLCCSVKMITRKQKRGSNETDRTYFSHWIYGLRKEHKWALSGPSGWYRTPGNGRDDCKEQGMEISDLFAQYGETYFRDLETKLIGSLREHRPSVISCGGGAVLREENTAMMKSMGKIVLLTASPMTIYHRVKDSTSRPVLNGHMNPDDIRKLMEIRRPRYEAAADLIISTDGKSVEEICREILCQMNSQ